MNQYGRSMIEMLGVLAIIGVMSVGGIAGYSKAMNKFKTNSTVELMQTMAANIRSVTLRERTFNNLEKVALKMKAIPQKALSSDGTSLGLNPFGGSIVISSFARDAFYIAMNNLPKDACVDVATRDYGEAFVVASSKTFDASKLATFSDKKLKMEAAACAAITDGYYCLGKKVSPASATSACSACGSSNTCSVTLIMY